MAKSELEVLIEKLKKAQTVEEAVTIANEIVELAKEAQKDRDEAHGQLGALNDQLKTTGDELAAEKQAHQNTQTEAAGIITGLKAQLAETEKVAEEGSAAVMVKHGNASYQVVVPKFKFNGKDYEAKSLKNHPAVIAELIEVGAGVLVKK